MPKISIIVPIYNTEKYLSACVNSVLSQKFTDYELLLVNDGSTDNSEAICAEFVNKDSRIKSFNKGNGGQPSALNYGLDRAQGKYVMFLDADDYWCDDEILDKLYTKAEKNNLDIVRGECKEVNNQGDIIVNYLNDGRSQTYGNKVVSSVLFIDKIVNRKYFMVLCLIKRTAIGDIRYNTNRVFLQDAEFNITLCSKGLACMYVPEVFYAYRKHDCAITVRSHPQKLYDAFNLSRFCFLLSQSDISDEMSRFCIKEGINNFLFDISVISAEMSWPELRESYAKYDLINLRKEAVRLLFKSSLKGKLRMCCLPLPILMFYYKMKQKVDFYLKSFKSV